MAAFEMRKKLWQSSLTTYMTALKTFSGVLDSELWLAIVWIGRLLGLQRWYTVSMVLSLLLCVVSLTASWSCIHEMKGAWIA